MSPPPIPPIPDWLEGILPTPEYQVKFLKTVNGKQEEHWVSNPGPQTWGMLCGCDEVLVGGRRGGGKSQFLIARSAAGDASLPADDPARHSFLNDRSYRGLFLRAEYQSMAEFVEEAIEFYRPFGGKPTGKPVQIEFESKAIIYFNHLGDEEAFEKYKGWNLTFIGIEELTQVKTLRRYLKLLGSLRSVARVRGGKTFPPLRTQIFSSTNPDGPGADWVKNRFVYVKDKKGELIPWNTPMKDPITKMSRIFIPFPIEANPYLSEDTAAGQKYRGMLMAQDEVTRKQWMEGDWEAGVGKFFTTYRPNGPVGDEKEKYPWANHIIPSAQLQPWWFRWGGGDWGYNHPSVFHKLCRNERDKRVHIYDELSLRQVGSFEVGAVLAKWWQPDLIALKASGRDPCVTIHMGADVFSKTDVVKTKAEQIEAGIREVLGPYGAILLKYDENEQEAMRRDPQMAKRMFDARRKSLNGQICIALKPIYFDRVAAWGYVRDMLRFRPAVMDLQTPEQRDKYLRQVLEDEGLEAYERQAADLRQIKPEILPKLQIWKACKELDRCLRAAMHNTSGDSDPSKPSRREDVMKFNADPITGEGGDDALECLSPGTMVETSTGPVAIEDIRRGDLVWTRMGLRAVLACGLIHRSRELVKVTFSNGNSLTGTRNHQVFVRDKGFVYLESLSNGDIIEAWHQSALSSTESSFDGTRNPPDATCGTTTGRGGITASAGLAHFIRRFGFPLTGQSPTSIISTISTRIRSIMKSETLTAFSAPSMDLCMAVPQRDALTCDGFRFWGERPQGHPTVDQNKSRPVGSTRSECLTTRRCSRWLRSLASSAGSLTRPEAQYGASSATSTAKQNGTEVTGGWKWIKPARFAGKRFQPTNTIPTVHVPVRVVASSSAGTGPVYDLSVNQNPEYFANGVLVHNSARNAAAAFQEIQTMMPLSYFVDERMGEIQAAHAEAFGEEITDPLRLAMINAAQTASYETKNEPMRGMNLARAGSFRHRGGRVN